MLIYDTFELQIKGDEGAPSITATYVDGKTLTLSGIPADVALGIILALERREVIAANLAMVEDALRKRPAGPVIHARAAVPSSTASAPNRPVEADTEPRNRMTEECTTASVAPTASFTAFDTELLARQWRTPADRTAIPLYGPRPSMPDSSPSPPSGPPPPPEDVKHATAGDVNALLIREPSSALRNTVRFVVEGPPGTRLALRSGVESNADAVTCLLDGSGRYKERLIANWDKSWYLSVGPLQAPFTQLRPHVAAPPQPPSRPAPFQDVLFAVILR